ncbi:hypothetical protein JHK84_050889 [Glycine max]|nr:hypothetical protein JHK86_050857 [Glycine max]KAG5095301.1 hypothetical protein JHK84_050889 [Glycine max]
MYALPFSSFLWLLIQKDLVIYEMNAWAFTSDESSGLDSNIRGSYLGMIEKIPHLLELGINAVELLPVFEFDELEFQRRPNPRDHMVHKAVDACKNVLRGLHSNKITERELDKDNDFKSLMQDQENALYLVISQFWKQGFIFVGE